LPPGASIYNAIVLIASPRIPSRLRTKACAFGWPLMRETRRAGNSSSITIAGSVTFTVEGASNSRAKV
jgi:hypothetical protein